MPLSPRLKGNTTSHLCLATLSAAKRTISTKHRLIGQPSNDTNSSTMDATYFFPNNPPPTDEDQQLRAECDALALQIAALEKTYRDLGLLFFRLRRDQHEDYLGAAAQHILETGFLPQPDGDVPELAKSMTALRPLLDPIKKHLHSLRFARVREAEAAAAREKLGKAKAALHLADRLLAPARDAIPGPFVRGPDGSQSRDVLPLMLVVDAFVPAPALPPNGGDARRADFKRWALTVREVQNAIELGSDEDAAVASLTMRATFDEERQVFDRLVGGADATAEDRDGSVSFADSLSDADDEDGEDAPPVAAGDARALMRFVFALPQNPVPDGHDDSDDFDDSASDVTNPYEDPIEDIPLHVLQAGLQRPGAPPPAVQPR